MRAKCAGFLFARHRRASATLSIENDSGAGKVKGKLRFGNDPWDVTGEVFNHRLSWKITKQGETTREGVLHLIKRRNGPTDLAGFLRNSGGVPKGLSATRSGR